MTNKQIALFGDVLLNMQHTLRTFEASVPEPSLVELEPGFKFFRYVEKLPTQAVVMKLARMTTALRSSMLLQAAGQLQDQGAIHRIIDEQNEDISFLSFAIIKNDFTANHTSFL